MGSKPDTTGSGTASTVPLEGSGAPPIVCSVIVGRVSTREGARIFEFLAAMRRQQADVEREVIVVDRINDALSVRIAGEFPEVTLVACPPDLTLPAMRATALARARGTYVAVTEDHCVPADNWLDSIVSTFREAPAGVVAVGGSVENGLPERLLDRATFQCEYGRYVPPVGSGIRDDLPGMNVAYLRQHLDALDPEVLRTGFWEGRAHAALRERGLLMLSSDGIRLAHRKHIAFMEFVRQRYWYSRYFAAQRYAGASVVKRAAALVSTPLLPAILLWRFHRAALRRPGYVREFLAPLPLLAIFTLVWAVGEMAGYAFGAGDSLRRLE